MSGTNLTVKAHQAQDHATKTYQGAMNRIRPFLDREDVGDFIYTIVNVGHEGSPRYVPCVIVSERNEHLALIFAEAKIFVTRA